MQGVVGDERWPFVVPLVVPCATDMVLGAQRPSIQPQSAAVAITIGNGIAKTDKARNASTASEIRAGWPSARPATRTTAWATIARTAGASPAKMAVTIVESPAAT